MRTEIVVTFDGETTKNGNEIYHFFPLPYILDKATEETTIYKTVSEYTGSSEIAKQVTEWAKTANVGETMKESGINVSVERW